MTTNSKGLSMDAKLQEKLGLWKAKLQEMRHQFETQANYDRSYWIGWMLCHGPAMIEAIEAVYARPVEHLSAEERALRAFITGRVRDSEQLMPVYRRQAVYEGAIAEQIREALYCAGATHLCPYCKQDFKANDEAAVKRHQFECKQHPLRAREHHLAEALLFISRLERIIKPMQLYDCDREKLTVEFTTFASWVARSIETCSPEPE